MDRYEKIIKGLEIFKKYEHTISVHAEHDEILAGPDPSVVSAEDLEQLEMLKWYPHEEECFVTFT